MDKITLKANEVLCTKDYSLFTFMEGNRNINHNHLLKVKKSFEKKQLPIPIIVTPSKTEDNKYEVFEGQHRWQTCKELELPIYYIVIEDLKLEDAIVINTISKKWNAEDYFQHYLTLGKEHYILLRNFMEVTGLSLHNARTFIDFSSAKGAKQQVEFVNGDFEVTDYNKSLDLYYKHLDFSECPAFNKASFKLSLLKILNHPHYEHERMLSKLEQGLTYKMTSRTTVSDYLVLFSEIYNYNAAKSSKVYFHLD